MAEKHMALESEVALGISLRGEVSSHGALDVPDQPAGALSKRPLDDPGSCIEAVISVVSWHHDSSDAQVGREA